MLIEYEISQEKTIEEYDKITEKCLINNTYGQIINDFKNSYTFMVENEKKYYFTYVKDKLHTICHLIIESENKCDLSIFFQEMISLSVLGIYLLSEDPILPVFDIKYSWETQINKNRELMIEKNRLYGSSWSILRSGCMTDLIHAKIHRISNILDGEKCNFESINDNFEDIINYSIFCQIRISLEKEQQNENT